MLKLLENNNIKFCWRDNHDNHSVNVKGVKIGDIVEYDVINKGRKSLEKTNIIGIKEMIVGNRLMTWKEICDNQGRSSKGRVPKWFKEIEGKVIDNNINRKIKSIFEIEDDEEMETELEDYWKKLSDCVNDNEETERLVKINNRLVLL